MNLSADGIQAIYDTVFYVTLHVAKALMAFLQRDSFLYWPFLVSSLAIAVLGLRRTG